MSFLKNILRNAISEGISKGIKDAVSSAAEKIVAPKAEELANKAAESLDNAAAELDTASEKAEKNEENGVSSLKESLDRLSKSAEKYAETLETAAKPQAALAEEWEKKLPGFPLWCFGGTDFWIDETGTDANGDPYYVFNADNATQEGLDLYVALLKESGFVRKYPSSDEILYKDLGGEYLVFGKTAAFEAAPVMTLSMCRTRDRSEIEI